MNIWHDISPKRITKDKFYAVIEISKGGKNKYELDKETGMLKLDRVLFTSTHYPANYGFIPRTFADDGDPLDVLVLCSETIQPMTLVECKPIGVLKIVFWKFADVAVAIVVWIVNGNCNNFFVTAVVINHIENADRLAFNERHRLNYFD